MLDLVALDNGHGCNTPGKRSPVMEDGRQLFEWEFNRDIVKRIAKGLDEIGIKYVIIVPEDEDISLTERCRRANKIEGNWFFLSIHANAGGGTGWEVHTSKGTTKSDTYANIFHEEANAELGKEFKMRGDYTDGDLDWDSNFTVLTKTKKPAVLTENLFMDTKKDCLFLLSEEGRQRIANLHIKAIKRIFELENGEQK